MFRTGIFLVLLVGLVACASPDVITERQIGDEDMDCGQLKAAIAEAEQFEREARRERGATGTNVAAALFFFPGLFATYANTQEAIDAARDRQDHLTRIANDRGCD